MDKMTPQERADAIDAGVIRSWDEVDDEFRARLLARVPEVAARGSHRVADRVVRSHETFSDDLDELLPPERSADGLPSVTDFLLYDLPRLRDLLADDYESNTLEVHRCDDLRILVQSGTLVRTVALYVTATPLEVLVLDVEIERFG